jgi:phosphoribosyl-ATP pyrophosphohydrolase
VNLDLTEDQIETVGSLPSVVDELSALRKVREEAIEVALAITHMEDGRCSLATVHQEMGDLQLAQSAYCSLFPEGEEVQAAVYRKLDALRAQFRPGEPEP